MAQQINVFRNNGFVNPTQLPFLCENTGALAIVEPGVTAGRLLGRQICCKIRKFNSVYLTFKMCIRHQEQIFSVDKFVPVARCIAGFSADTITLLFIQVRFLLKP